MTSILNHRGQPLDNKTRCSGNKFDRFFVEKAVPNINIQNPLTVIFVPGIKTPCVFSEPLFQYLISIFPDCRVMRGRGIYQLDSKPDIQAMYTATHDEIAKTTGPIILLGHSGGGAISYALANAFKERVDLVCSMGTNCKGIFGDEPRYNAIRDALGIIPEITLLQFLANADLLDKSYTVASHSDAIVPYHTAHINPERTIELSLQCTHGQLITHPNIYNPIALELKKLIIRH